MCWSRAWSTGRLRRHRSGGWFDSAKHPGAAPDTRHVGPVVPHARRGRETGGRPAGLFRPRHRRWSGDCARTRRFRGKVAVLIGPTCSSATFRFADLVQRNRLATLVGEPTGGNRRGINGGRYFFVRLPETGFEVDLPLVGYFPLSEEPDRGLDPDILVRPRLADMVAGVDPALAAAVKVVRG